MVDTDFYAPLDKVNRFAAAYTMSPQGTLMPVILPRLDPLQVSKHQTTFCET